MMIFTTELSTFEDLTKYRNILSTILNFICSSNNNNCVGCSYQIFCEQYRTHLTDLTRETSKIMKGRTGK